ncbi:MAG: hypothetical protein LBC20_03440 [Planctomycetaceae bacterium]|jgi:hypothetical protein|nr:hypothetical protein [Planctomycetaceae bacterium]
MKSRILMAALVVTLLMGVRVFASDCGPCDPASDPCGACDSCNKSCDLFSGLKKLVDGRPFATSDCGPCDGVVACSPCDEAACNPCDEISCDDVGGKKFTFGKRLKSLFATKNCNPCDEVGDCGPCDEVGDCNPCDVVSDCNPCDDADGCSPCDSHRKFSLRKFFKGFKLAGRCDDGCGSPCDEIGDCNPCDDAGSCDGSCNPCDEIDCNPCDNSCGQKFGHLFDKPRRNIKKFFDGFSFGKCDTGCNPCDAIGPCDVSCIGTPAASQLPEAGK